MTQKRNPAKDPRVGDRFRFADRDDYEFEVLDVAASGSLIIVQTAAHPDPAHGSAVFLTHLFVNSSPWLLQTEYLDRSPRMFEITHLAD
jgi:hypothetical protein